MASAARLEKATQYLGVSEDDHSAASGQQAAHKERGYPEAAARTFRRPCTAGARERCPPQGRPQRASPGPGALAAAPHLTHEAVPAGARAPGSGQSGCRARSLQGVPADAARLPETLAGTAKGGRPAAPQPPPRPRHSPLLRALRGPRRYQAPGADAHRSLRPRPPKPPRPMGARRGPQPPVGRPLKERVMLLAEIFRLARQVAPNSVELNESSLRPLPVETIKNAEAPRWLPERLVRTAEEITGGANETAHNPGDGPAADSSADTGAVTDGV
ncbi:uncharacterized protein ACBT57_015623 [Dama dama]